MKFEDMKISEAVCKALREKEYDVATPIQAQAIPIVMEGTDVLGLAQTGTGKTAAFAIPIIEQLMNNFDEEKKQERRNIKALILTPTRELALQIDESFSDYGKYVPLRHTVIFGGVNQKSQTDALRSGVDILIATPGRLLDLMSQGFIHLSDVRHFVLDEADRMLDMGFIHDIKKIIPKLPVKRQTLLFSATMPDSIDRLAKTLLRHPKRVETTPSASVVETIKQELYKVDKPDKKQLLINILLKEKGNSVLIFSRTKHGADNIARILNRKGIGCESIHGNKSQNARIRALTNFKEGVSNVIVATDIAARGIDINQLDLVINYDMPDVAETYVHRIGRTGRAGNSGRAVTFCTPEDKEMLNDIEKLIGFRVPVSGCFVSQTANKDTLDDSASKPITKRSSKTQSRKQESVKITANDKNDRRNSHHIKEQKANVRSNKSSDRRSVKTQSGENRTTKTKQLVNNESKNNFNSVNVRQKVAKPADNRNKPKRMPSRFDNGGMF